MLLALRSLWEQAGSAVGAIVGRRRRLPRSRVAQHDVAVSVGGVAASPQIGFANVAIAHRVAGVAAQPQIGSVKLVIGYSALTDEELLLIALLG